MKGWMALAALAWAGGLSAEPVTLVNLLPQRPLWSLVTGRGTATVAPATNTALRLEARSFSGLGLKNLALAPGSVYYAARFGDLPRLYALGPTQVLIVNLSTRALRLTVGDQSSWVAAGVPALGEVAPDRPLTIAWSVDDGPSTSVEVTQPGLYRLEAQGDGWALTPWSGD